MVRLAVTAAVAALLLAACGDTSKDTDADTPQEPAAPEATYETQAFSLPLSVAVPSRYDDGPFDSATFVTWESATPSEPAVRFLIPAAVYRPGEAEATTPPEDYLGYLLSQEDSGAVFSDTEEITVDGQQATVVTATAAESLEGSLGCPREDTSAADCFGLQPDLSLRIAVLDVADRTLVAWLRHEGAPDSAGAADEFAEFEAMLRSIEFLDRGPVESSSTAGEATAVDGVWRSSFSRMQLIRSPLLYDAGEINDQNWGDFTLTLDHGEFSLEQENPRESSHTQGTFTVDGEVLTLSLESSETFDMRFAVKGNTLTLERDDALGISPTPLVLEPWRR